ncbi:MAG: FAD-binding protein [Bdellovibrionales bacterium]|nr:FAD-binding protein [Bdellovibrionales bacterium]
MISRDVRLAPMTSWLVGGPAEYYVEPSSEAELEEALRFAHEQKLPVTVLGGGTNVLISDKGIRGLVIVLKRFNQAKVSE